jgi:hypothetical protein
MGVRKQTSEAVQRRDGAARAPECALMRLRSMLWSLWSAAWQKWTKSGGSSPIGSDLCRIL